MNLILIRILAMILPQHPNKNEDVDADMVDEVAEEEELQEVTSIKKNWAARRNCAQAVPPCNQGMQPQSQAQAVHRVTREHNPNLRLKLSHHVTREHNPLYHPGSSPSCTNPVTPSPICTTPSSPTHRYA